MRRQQAEAEEAYARQLQSGLPSGLPLSQQPRQRQEQQQPPAADPWGAEEAFMREQVAFAAAPLAGPPVRPPPAVVAADPWAAEESFSREQESRPSPAAAAAPAPAGTRRPSDSRGSASNIFGEAELSPAKRVGGARARHASSIFEPEIESEEMLAPRAITRAPAPALPDPTAMYMRQQAELREQQLHQAASRQQGPAAVPSMTQMHLFGQVPQHGRRAKPESAGGVPAGMDTLVRPLDLGGAPAFRSRFDSSVLIHPGCVRSQMGLGGDFGEDRHQRPGAAVSAVDLTAVDTTTHGRKKAPLFVVDDGCDVVRNVLGVCPNPFAPAARSVPIPTALCADTTQHGVANRRDRRVGCEVGGRDRAEPCGRSVWRARPLVRHPHRRGARERQGPEQHGSREVRDRPGDGAAP